MLDAFEVTNERFEKFLAAYDGTPPPAGAGAHPRFPNSGWDPEWNAFLPATGEDFRKVLAGEEYQTQGGELQTRLCVPIGEGPNYPFPCATWVEAMMFCAGDGGRLPTAAEWFYAAAGGAENRDYPWGGVPGEWSDDGTHFVSVDCDLVSTFAFGYCDPFPPVGSSPRGRGRWGHHDLLGSAGQEWLFDHSDAVERYADPLLSTAFTFGDYEGDTRLYVQAWVPSRPYARGYPLKDHDANIGFRCVHDYEEDQNNDE